MATSTTNTALEPLTRSDPAYFADVYAYYGHSPYWGPYYQDPPYPYYRRGTDSSLRPMASDRGWGARGSAPAARQRGRGTGGDRTQRENARRSPYEY